MVIPAVGAAESSDTENTVVTNATTDQNLQIGMTGENVTQLQTWLQTQGFYKGKIDGNSVITPIRLSKHSSSTLE